MVTKDKLDSAVVWSVIYGAIKHTSALILATGVIGTVVWWAIQPRVEDYLDTREEPIKSILTDIQANISEIQNIVADYQRPVLNFQGGGVVSDPGPFTAGGLVPIIYSLRRNRSCPTTVEVRFWDVRLGRINTSLTYTIQATQAPVTNGFIGFSIDVRLPDHIEDGWYAYYPRIIPEDGCGDAITAGPSTLFQVKN